MTGIFQIDEPIIKLLEYFLIGLVASFYGSITGVPFMLSIPALIFMGIPAETVFVTNKLGDLGRFSLSTFRFVKSGKAIWKYAVPFIPLAITGGLLGAKLPTIYK
ncbi:TSUP family transporter [Gaetbulibacter sp. M235]|uniref:TSUP family transporter n=1 Tax=Gaetbulibacter sp. M235 TaxID=3126510 RepID=UPI00374F40F4